MLTIKRACANKIITRVLSAGDRAFTAILIPGADDCIAEEELKNLQESLSRHPDAYVIYNQHPQAESKLEALGLNNRQIVIEVRQETRGVLGLEARYYGSAAEDIVELVFPEAP